MRIVLDTTKLTNIFIVCDDFSKNLAAYCLAYQTPQPPAERLMSESEMMAIVIFYHHSGFKCFKYYYEQIIGKALRSYFPHTYNCCRFVYLMQQLNFHCLSCSSAAG